MICPRCQRETMEWPLRRADVCSPKDWVFCLREPEAITVQRTVQQARQATLRSRCAMKDTVRGMES